MKYLLLLLLVGCVQPYEPKAPEPKTVPSVGATSSGQFYSVAWRCEEQEVNDKLVWIQCNFHNNSSYFYSISTCINVSYQNGSGDDIVTSRDICSGELVAEQSSENYVAFIKLERNYLTAACNNPKIEGSNLNYCFMVTKAVKK